MKEPLFIAFDVDNTLLDADMSAYRRTVMSFAESVDAGLSVDKTVAALESIRVSGHALERLGLDNPIHDRGCPHGMAAFRLLHCADNGQCRAMQIEAGHQGAYTTALARLIDLDRQTKHGTFDARLEAERRTRAFIFSNEYIRRLRDEVIRLAAHREVVEASGRYKAIEASQPAESRANLMESLVARGFSPVIITEGRTEIQSRKIARCGLGADWSDRIMITEETAGVPGLVEFDKVLSQHLDAESANHSAPPSVVLSHLWHYRCLVDAWAHKTPWFFARCLHAIQQSPHAPRTALQPPQVVPHAKWKPFRFVMAGDRYDKDVEPVMSLLGPGIGLTIRLCMGKYGELHPQESMDRSCRPGKTFSDWDSLTGFLLNDIESAGVAPIVRPPPIANGALMTPSLIEFGLQSKLEAVRAIAQLFVEISQDVVT